MIHDQDVPNLDDTIIQLPSDIREDLAYRGAHDLFFFGKAIMGYKEMTVGCHLPLCVFLDDHPSRFKLVLQPRGHYKTSVGTISRTTQKVCYNPNQRVLILNETANNAQNFLSAIRRNFESNKILRSLYSSVIPKDTRKVRWSGEEIELNRTVYSPQATITAMGMTSALTSGHYTHLAIDDPISEEAAKSMAVMLDAISRIDKLISLMADPEKDTFDLIGTRWAIYDVYSVFMKKYGPKMARFIRAAIKDGQPIFPELISLETLAQARANMGEYMFSCLYMNNPRDVANQDFNVEDLKFWRMSTDEESVILYDKEHNIEGDWPINKLDITVSVDLAMSETITSDRNAVVTVGSTPDGRAVVLDTWVRRCTPLEVIEHLFWLKQRYAVRTFGIEGVAYQKAFKYFLRAECDRRGQYMNITELKAIPSKRGTGNNSKPMRIRGLQPIAATGRLYILPTQHELRNEMADFPLGEHDDCIDALAHQLTMWRGLLSEAARAKYKASEDALIQRVTNPDVALLEPHMVDLRVHPRDRVSAEDLGWEPQQFGEFQDYVIR